MSQANADVGKFKWGNKKRVGLRNADVQFYESFVYEGVEYSLYDCVYFYHTYHVETSIGKLVKIYERLNREKMVKVVWFFRPTEIRKFLGKYQPHWNELFLATGAGKGLSNLNSLESIIGKCNVVCTSGDNRNPKPSEIELERADFFFKYSFDVGRRVIIDKFTDEIDGVKVEQFFNRKGDKMTINHLQLGTNKRPKIVIKSRTDLSGSLSGQVEDKDEVRTSENVLPKRSLDSFPYKKRRITEEKSTISQSSPNTAESDKKEELRQDNIVTPCRNVIEVTQRPDAEKKSWFKMPWEERLQRAQQMDTLVLLNNLDPSYTSYEVEDLVWNALKEKVVARMIEWSPSSNTHYGRAFVIFKTKNAAENAISELNKRCLILEDGRIVTARRGTVRDPGKQSKLTGHLTVNRAVFQKQHREMRTAVSTSHCSQPNTIEYGMAIEWMHQYHKSDACWNALYEKQMKEIDDVKSKLKMDRIFG